MITLNIRLASIADVKSFVYIANRYDFTIELASPGGYKVDGKSIMGIFSLDLETDLLLSADVDAESDEGKTFVEEASAFECEKSE